MSKVKQIKVALLALVAALVIAIPGTAFADITISETNQSHEYGAYQVFTGEFDTNGKLTNIDWGSNINGAGLIADLKASGPQAIKDYLAAIEGTPTAAQVAAAIDEVDSNVGENRDTGIDVVADLINKNLKGNAFATATYATGGYKLQIPDTASGYYFIKDTKTSDLTGDPTALTRYILTLSNVANPIAPKSSVPEVEKGVIEDSNNPVDDAATAEVDERAVYEAALANYIEKADYDINQGIPYDLVGTLPSSYIDYTKGYRYIFHDTFSAGLTMSDEQVNNVKVWFYDNGAPVKDITSSFAANDALDGGKGITFASGKLIVGIDNLKTAVTDTDFASATNPQIVVFYKASLTSDCVIGGKGNPNEVYLEFSNNPNWDGNGKPGTDETEKDYAVVFTYTLDDTKIDAQTEDVLKDAKFKLQATNGEFANKWAVIADGKLTGWTDTEEGGSVITSDAQGKFGVKGLDAGAYSLKEIEAPAGYNIGGPYAFTITAVTALDASKGMDGGSVTSITLNNTAKDIAGDPATGVVGDTITNTSGSGLPSTGGIGTTIFYVVGGGLIIAALIAMVVRRRKSATAA